jgi:hypothetical protein
VQLGVGEFAWRAAPIVWRNLDGHGHSPGRDTIKGGAATLQSRLWLEMPVRTRVGSARSQALKKRCAAGDRTDNPSCCSAAEEKDFGER